MGQLSKDKRDIYYRMAKDANYRARSVYKLIQVDDELGFLKNATKVVDLCAAPGSWSQGLTKILNDNSLEKPKIIAVDLQPMEYIPGVTSIIGDITLETTANTIIQSLSGELADVVVCDGASDTTGLHHLDEIANYTLLQASFAITTHILKTGGNFMCKIFHNRNSTYWANRMLSLFEQVYIAKPNASRQSSNESFLVCKYYTPIEHFRVDLKHAGYFEVPFPKTRCPSNDNNNNNNNHNNNKKQKLTKVEFVMCHSRLKFDGDTSYPLDVEHITGVKYTSRDPIQLPTNPPYKQAVKLKKSGIHGNQY